MKRIRLLTIGNSFSQNALTYLEDIAADGGKVSFEIGRASLGGCSLEKHWNLATYTERCPDYKTYNLYEDKDGSLYRANLQEALSVKEWDCISLQQVSRKSWRRESFQPYLGNLLGMIKERASQAEVLLHQTWAYRSDTPYLPENCITQEIMHKQIVDTYHHFSAETGCRLLPSGEAIHAARQAEGRTFVWPESGFDYQHAEAPELPEQKHSLAVGWKWAINNSPEGIPEMRLDANHLNARGCYLAGCVWYEVLTGLDVTRVSFAPPEIESETASFLRGIAHETVG